MQIGPAAVGRKPKFVTNIPHRFSRPEDASLSMSERKRIQSLAPSWSGLRIRPTRLGLDADAYGTHTMRRTKASLIYPRTKNLRAVQLLLGHSKLESTVRYLGIEVDDALEMAEQTEV